MSKIEEKILGRLAKAAAPTNALLSQSLYQVLGLSILLTRSLARARRRRSRLETSNDSDSIRLYHHIIWLAREGLSITEVYILPYCQNGRRGTVASPQCRVMAAKLRASFYKVFCMYHNLPPISQMSAQSYDSSSPQSSVLSPGMAGAQARRSPGTTSRNNGRDNGGGRSKRAGKAPLRDPIPSMTSDTSYITNPYAALPSQTPPPLGPPPPIPTETRRTPTRPPGLAPIDIPASQSTASFLLPPINFVPLAREHFETAQHLAVTLLPPTDALRLAVGFEYALFLWDCAKESNRSRRIAKRTIRDVYDSSDPLSDEEFEDAQLLVRSLGGIVRRGGSTTEPTPKQSRDSMRMGSPSQQRTTRATPQMQIDRTIAVSPPQQQYQQQRQQASRIPSPGQARSGMTRTPDRLSTVPEIDSVDGNGISRAQTATTTTATASPPVSRLSSRSNRQRRPSSNTSSDKAIKRRAAEQAEEQYHRRNSGSRSSNDRNPGSAGSSRQHSRQATPQQEGYVGKPKNLPPEPQARARHRASRNGNR